MSQRSSDDRSPTQRTDVDDDDRTDDEDEPTDTGVLSLSRDDAYHLMQNKRRRAVLRYLLSTPDQERFEMREVAEAVAAWEHGTTVEQLDSNERQRVYISLYQTHLPKLAEHGVVDYDQPRGTIVVQPLAHVLEPILDVEAGLNARETIDVSNGDDDRSDDADADTEGLLSKFGIYRD